LKAKYFDSKYVVLHRRELISAKPPFETLKDDVLRNLFNEDMLAIISESSYKVISVVIDKKTLVDKYTILKAPDPYALALEFLMQCYQQILCDYAEYGKVVQGDILAESRGGCEDKTTKETYRLMYNGHGYNKLNDARIYFSSKEIKLSKKKDNIAGLQFVDLISHPARRYILSQNNLSHNVKKTSYEQRIVEVLVEGKFYRKDTTIDGYGTIFYPK
jgi:hypothetical protein